MRLVVELSVGGGSESTTENEEGRSPPRFVTKAVRISGAEGVLVSVEVELSEEVD